MQTRAFGNKMFNGMTGVGKLDGTQYRLWKEPVRSCVLCFLIWIPSTHGLQFGTCHSRNLAPRVQKSGIACGSKYASQISAYFESAPEIWQMRSQKSGNPDPEIWNCPSIAFWVPDFSINCNRWPVIGIVANYPGPLQLQTCRPNVVAGD